MYEGGLSPKYVADEAELYELAILIKHLDKKDRGNWEQSRMISYVVAQVNSTKKIKPSDIMPFPWDREHPKDVTISESERERLQKKANQYIKEHYGS